MSSDRLSEIFEDCLTRLNAGATVEQCLRDYPADADRLRPLLDTVTVMRRALPSTGEVVAAQNRTRARMFAAMQDVTPVTRRRSASRRWLGTMASVAVMIFALVGILSFAAEGALPGDALYAVKLLSESARLTVVRDPALAAAFAQRRIDEVKSVLADGRQVNVSFAAHVVTMSGARWDVGGVPVDVGSATKISAPIQPGDEVRVEGFASAGAVQANSITKMSEPQPQSTPIAPTTPAPGISLTIIPRLAETPIALTETPVGSCTPTAPTGWITYNVRAGDSMSRLAAATSTSLDTLLAVNCLKSNGILSIGQTLFLPSIPPTQPPRATAIQPIQANTAVGGSGSDNGGSGTTTQGSGSATTAGNDDHGGGSNSGSSGSGNGSLSGNDDNGGSGNSGSGSSGSNGGSNNSGSGSSGDSGSSGGSGDDGGSSGHGGGSDDGGGHGGSNDDD